MAHPSRSAPQGPPAGLGPAAATDRKFRLQWFGPGVESLGRLPWHGKVWSSENPKSLDDDTVARLLLLLREFLPVDGPVSHSCPNWDGGVMASWEFGDLYLEVESYPGQPAQCCSVDERDGGDYSDEFALTGREDDLRRYMEVVNRVEAERSAGFEEDGGRSSRALIL